MTINCEDVRLILKCLFLSFKILYTNIILIIKRLPFHDSLNMEGALILKNVLFHIKRGYPHEFSKY